MSKKIPKLTEGVKLRIITPPGSSSLDWMQWQREINSVLDEINLEKINHQGKPFILLHAQSEGIYDLIPFDCEIKHEDGYKIREDQFLMETSEEKLEGKTELITTGFAFPIKITLYNTKEQYPDKGLLEKIVH